MTQKHMLRHYVSSFLHSFFVLFFEQAHVRPLLARNTGGPGIEVPSGPETCVLMCVSPVSLGGLRRR
jgi:hypothetical protein